MFEWLILSMKAIYNSRIIDQEDIQISTNNRAFCYGDGLFETIVTGPRRINLIDDHIKRLKADCSVLRLDFPEEIEQNLRKWMGQLSQLNTLQGDVRTKINVWRKEGGLYSPTDNSSEFLITVKETRKPVYRASENIGISKSTANHYSSHSKIKSVNALNYVLAGIEKDERKLNEIIILDNDGNLSETHIGNLFWIKDERLFTPSLETGCIAGIMRGFIISFYNGRIEQVKAKPEKLIEAESIFSTNASGIEYFKFLEGSEKEFIAPDNTLKDLIKRIQQP